MNKTIQIMAFTHSTNARKRQWIPISFNQILEGEDKLTLGYNIFKILVDGEQVYIYNATADETVKNVSQVS